MYGGWLKKKPYMFDKDNNIVSGDSRQLYTETFRDIKTVKNKAADLFIDSNLHFDFLLFYEGSAAKMFFCLGQAQYTGSSG